MKQSSIPMGQVDQARRLLEEMEQAFGKVRTDLRAGNPAAAAYDHANGNAAFQPQVVMLYGVVIGPL